MPEVWSRARTATYTPSEYRLVACTRSAPTALGSSTRCAKHLAMTTRFWQRDRIIGCIGLTTIASLPGIYVRRKNKASRLLRILDSEFRRSRPASTADFGYLKAMRLQRRYNEARSRRSFGRQLHN